MGPNEINAAICKSFGIDPAQACNVEIMLCAGDFPSVRVTRRVLSADGIADRIEHLQLRPQTVNEFA